MVLGLDGRAWSQSSRGHFIFDNDDAEEDNEEEPFLDRLPRRRRSRLSPGADELEGAGMGKSNVLPLLTATMPENKRKNVSSSTRPRTRLSLFPSLVPLPLVAARPGSLRPYT